MTSLKSVAAAAARIWEFGTGRRRFYEAKNGQLKIRLIYTHRQDAVEAIKLLEAESKLVLESVNEFNTEMDRLNRKIDEYNKRMREHDEEVARHNAEVQQYQNQPGRKPAFYQHLKRQGAILNDHAAELRSELNILEMKRKKMDAKRQNIGGEVSDFHKDQVSLEKILARMPDYERLGEYRQKGGERQINLYVVRNKKQLKLLLAHEFGHALGIGHVQQPGSLMYPRETLENTDLRTLQPGDMKAFRKLCGKVGQNPTGHYF
jgi:alanyl-tRNA synthetase